MKFARMLILALGLMTLATASSFAVVPFNNIASVSTINMDAQTGLVGGITFSALQAGTITAGEVLTISLPPNVPISYLSDISVAMTGTVGTGSTFKDNFGTSNPQYVPGGYTWTNLSANGFTSYGVPITSPTNNANRSGVSVVVGTTAPAMNIITITFGRDVNIATTDVFQVNGVRVDPASVSSGSGANIQATFGSQKGDALFTNGMLILANFVYGNQVMAGTVSGNATVGTVPGLSFKADGSAASTGTTLVTVTLRELFVNAFETKTYSPYAQIWSNTKIKFNFTIPSNLPLTITGVTLNGPDGATFTNGQYASTPPTQNGILTSFPAIYVGIMSQNALNYESLQVGLTFAVKSGYYLPPSASTPITVTALLDPPAPTITGGNPDYPLNKAANQGSSYYQQYQLKYRATANPVQLSIPVSIVPFTSNLLSTYNVALHNPVSEGNYLYDTGMVVTNLSGTNPSGTYPIAAPGTITFYLYPSNGANMITIDSSNLPAAVKTATGLDANGALASRQSFQATLTGLLQAVGYSNTADFVGFIRIKCNFQESVGVAWVGDGNFSKFAAGYPMIYDTPATVSSVPVILPVF